MKIAERFDIIFVVLFLALIAAIAIPCFVPSRSIGPHNTCINNLRNIDNAKEQWASLSGQTNGTPPDIEAINRYMRDGMTPECPSDGIYSYNPTGTDPTCSIRSPVPHRLPKSE